MSKAVKRRRFLRWRKYRRQCERVTGHKMLLTLAMSEAWYRTMYPVRSGRFYAMMPW